MSVRGFEPRTTWLKVKCSTTWATRPYSFRKENAQNRNRTSDTRIFSPLLYQLSYLGIDYKSLSCGSRIWTCDLRVMSPTSFQTAPSRDIKLISQKRKADDRTRTDNLLITNQLLCQLSHIGIFNCQMTPTGFEPVLPPWKGDVLTAWPWGQVFKSSSPSRARTYNPSVNSRVLYHWAIEEYHLVNHGVFVNVNTFDLKMQVFFIFF